MPCRARLIGSVARRSRLEASSHRRAAASDRSNSPRPSCTRRQLQVDHRRVASAPSATASAARFLEPVEVERDEQVDGAELLQRPHPPQGQPGGGGDVVRLLEGRLGRRRVPAALGAAEHFERLALHLRLLAVARAPATPPWPSHGDLDVVAAPWPPAPPAHCARARRATSGASAAAAWACSSARSHRPRGQVGGPHEQVHRGLVGGITAPLQQLRAERSRPFRVPGQHADLQQDVVDLVGQRAGGELASTGGERLRRCQRALTRARHAPPAAGTLRRGRDARRDRPARRPAGNDRCRGARRLPSRAPSARLGEQLHLGRQS